MTVIDSTTRGEGHRWTNAPARAAARRPITAFVVLAMALSWVFIPVADGDLLPHGPMLAAVVVLAVLSGRRGVRELWAAMTRWRVRPGWYLVAPGIFLAMHAAALVVSAGAGLRIGGGGLTLSAGMLLAMWLPLVLAGGQWEEPGWLGYLARRLQQTRPGSPLTVLLAAGLVRMVWHTPLVLAGAIPWYDYVFGSLALQVILLWMYNRTGGSILLPMICHLFSNLTLATALTLLDEPDRWRYWLVFVVIETAVAVGVLVATRGRLGAAQPAAQPR